MTDQTGIAITFNPKDFITVAQQLVDADEVERAISLLDNVPAFFRQHQHPDILAFKESILSRMITPSGYLNDAHDCELMSAERARAMIDHTLRGHLIAKELSGDESYHVTDVGPGEYWLPIGIDGAYSYRALGLDQKTRLEASTNRAVLLHSNREPNPINVFVALEVIEHLPCPRDLAVECAKHLKTEPHYIHLSTPLYTFDSSPKQEAKYLPHLRAYTPNEFLIEAHKLWPHYEWQPYLQGPIMSLRGLHPNAKRRERLI